SSKYRRQPFHRRATRRSHKDAVGASNRLTSTAARELSQLLLDQQLEVVIRSQERRRRWRESAVDQKSRACLNPVTVRLTERSTNGLTELPALHALIERVAVHAGGGGRVGDPLEIDGACHHECVVIRPEFALSVRAQRGFGR